MKVLIVAKTRRGAGACVGAITEHGQSVRLIAADAAGNDRAGLEYEVGEVWEVESSPDPHIIPPHVENIIVHQARRERCSTKLRETVERFMPPAAGGPDQLFDGLVRATSAGSLYISHTGRLPARSTMFWRPDQPLQLDPTGKRIRYRYPGRLEDCSLTFVGFQEPLSVVPAGTLVRISLAHPWRPQDRPQDELRCFLQISGWSLEETTKVAHPSAATYAVTPHQDLKHREEVRVDEAHLALAKQKLRSIFGFDSFHPLQAEVIARVLTGRDTLVVMPTGGGKSLCYQLPALLLDGLTLVITPLVALMHDQVRQLAKLKIPAACLNHTVSHRDWTAITDQVRDGRIQLLYLAPETMLRPEILVLLEQSRLACVAVDEAHCLSEWGHDFRPEFRQLPQLRKRFPGAVCLGLTATATERVRQDIGQVLQIPRDGQLVARFNRENLFLAARKRFKSGISQIVPFVEAQSGNAGIIYCGTRKQADQLSAGLNEYGIPSVPYHAGMEDEVRHENQAKFTKGEVPLIVATVAFGMGINKPDVRFVIHAHLPHDLESYYQEIGRAGRDGLPAYCLLLYSWADVIVHRHFIEQGAQNQRSGRFSRLTALTRFAESAGCRRVPLLSYFGERFAGGCNACDRCVEVLPACYEEREIPNLVTPRRRRRAQRKDTGTKPSRREKAVVCMFEEGRSIEEVAGHFQVKPKRVLQYLESHAATGGHLDAERILGESTLEPELRDTALEVFRRIGFKRLSPVHRALHEAVTFDDLRLLRLYLMAQPQALTHSSR